MYGKEHCTFTSFDCTALLFPFMQIEQKILPRKEIYKKGGEIRRHPYVGQKGDHKKTLLQLVVIKEKENTFLRRKGEKRKGMGQESLEKTRKVSLILG